MSINSKLETRAASLRADSQKVAREATTSPIVETLLRLGYVVRGMVYGVIGLLALQVVIGSGGALTDPQGAIAAMGQTPLGQVLLYIVLAGLVGYGLWGLIRALADPLHKGDSPKGIAERLGFAISGISYLMLGLTNFNLITGRGAAASGTQTAQAQQAVGNHPLQTVGRVGGGRTGARHRRRGCAANLSGHPSGFHSAIQTLRIERQSTEMDYTPGTLRRSSARPGLHADRFFLVAGGLLP